MSGSVFGSVGMSCLNNSDNMVYEKIPRVALNSFHVEHVNFFINCHLAFIIFLCFRCVVIKLHWAEIK